MKFLVSATLAAGFLSVAVAHAADDNSQENPRLGRVTYYGTGTAERAPDYGEVYVTFKVECQSSPEAVVQAINAASHKLWNTILKEVSPENYSETERTYWTEIRDIAATDSTTIKEKGEGKSVKLVRVDRCTQKEIALDAKVPFLYGGSQRLGVRTSKLDWLEALVASVKKQPDAKNPSDLKATTDGIAYAVTRATEESMKAEVEKEAADQAIGQDSDYRADLSTLRIQEAFFVGRRTVPYAPQIGEQIGEAVQSGTAPRVTLKVKMKYGFSIATKNLLQRREDPRIDPAPNAPSAKPANNTAEYEEIGEAQALADYAQLSVTVRTSCHASQADALAALKAKSSKVIDTLKAIQGNKEPSETDRLTVEEERAFGRTAVRPIEDRQEDGKTIVTRYRNTCTSEIYDANEATEAVQNRLYYEASQKLTLRSVDFAGIVASENTLVSLNDQNPSTSSVVVESNSFGKVKEVTRKALLIQARKDAAARLQDVNSALNREGGNADVYGYQNAYLINIEVAEADSLRPLPQARSLGLEKAAIASDGRAAPGAPPEELDLQIENRDNNTRPTLSLRKTLAFDLRILTSDFLEEAKLKNLSN